MDNPEPVNLQNLSLASDEADDYDKCTVELSSGLRVRDLQNEDGAHFEIKAPIETDPDAEEYFDSDQIFKQLNQECLGEDEEDQEDESVTPFEKIAKRMRDITPEESGRVLKTVLREGTGGLPVQGVTVTVHYNCYLEYSDEPYDSTRLRNRPEKQKLGKGALIMGMELALSTMRKGELAKFLIHPDYAFGKQGVPPRIPGNATILMEIELLGFTDRAELDEFNAMSEEERKEVSFKKKLHVVNTERQEGNELVKNGNHRKALSNYTKGLRILDGAHLRNQEEEDEMRHVQVKLCLNIALCSLKLKQYPRTIGSCNRVLEAEPKNPKALYRKGKALMYLGEFREAHRHLTMAQREQPSDPSVAKSLQELDSYTRRWKSMEQSLYSKMFPHWNKDSNQKGATPSAGKVTDEFKKIIREKLKGFQELTDIVEMPFPTRSMTTGETDFLETVAKEMGMTVQRREVRGEKILKVTKPTQTEPENGG